MLREFTAAFERVFLAMAAVEHHSQRKKRKVYELKIRRAAALLRSLRETQEREFNENQVT